MTSTLKYFKEITAIPRPSKHETQIAHYLENFFQSHGFLTTFDQADNLIVRIPAKNAQSKQTIILQAHMDMVCVKEKWLEHDFFKDPLSIYEEDGWLKAKGTTLWADNGAGIAMIMNVIHLDTRPEIIAVFTTDEEAGMTGVMQIDASLIKDACMIINLDNEDEDELCIGSAWGLGINANIPIQRKQCLLATYEWKVQGMKGGHSGVEIDKNRWNALRLMMEIITKYPWTIEILHFEGGTAHNVIPSEGLMYLWIDDFWAFQEICTHCIATQKLLIDSPDLRYSLIQHPTALAAIQHWEKICAELLSFHDGVISMSGEVKWAVETSLNLWVINTHPNEWQLSFLARSSKTQKLENLSKILTKSLQDMKAHIDYDRGYPWWQDSPHSKLVHITKEVLSDTLWHEPRLVSVHAWLECGALVWAINDMGNPDVHAISIGPTILGAHSTDEKMLIASLEKMEKALAQILKKLSEKED